ncbi:MAG: helix-turn-helix transcriptional regulator [Bauldia sp.]
MSAFRRVIDRAYDAALGDLPWFDLVEALAEEFSATAVLIPSVTDLGYGLPLGALTISANAAELEPVPRRAESSFGLEPLMSRVWATPRGHASIVARIQGDSAVQELPYWPGYFESQRIGHSLHILAPSRQGRATFICLLREPSQPPFSRREAEFLELISPHVDRAIGLSERSYTHPAADLFARPSSLASFLLDRDARVVGSNEAGQQLLAEHIALRAGHLKVHHADVDLSKHLRSLTEQPNAFITAFSLSRIAPKGPLNFVLARSMPSWPLGAGVAAILFASEQGAVAGPPREALRKQFGLTEAELNLVRAFVAERGLKEASSSLGIQWETARRHIKSVFEKTDTHSQVELMHLLLTHPASAATPLPQLSGLIQLAIRQSALAPGIAP